MLTRRSTQRQFLLRPGPETNNTFLYCLGVAAQRADVDIILPVMMSNHHHTNLYDRNGTVVEFYEHFHKLLAKAQNAFWGRWENLWSSEPPCLVRLVDPMDVIDKLVYAATNPVKDGLVERVRHWPGVNGLAAFLADRPLHAYRPTHFFREDGAMPEEVTIRLVIPPALGDPAEVRRIVRERVEAFEEAKLAERARTGATVLGRKAVRKQSWRDSPSSSAPHGGLRPRVAARSAWSRIEALRRNSAFVDAYRTARALWLAGMEAVFPAGTYWLQRFAGVTVAPPVEP